MNTPIPNMTRKDQYKLFFDFFESENKRYEYLNQRASFFVGFLSGFSLFAGLNLETLVKKIPQHPVTLGLIMVSGVLLLLAILCSVISMWLRNYADICNTKDLIIEIEKKHYGEEDIYSILLANLADAIDYNRRVNNARATWLVWAGISLALALLVFISLNIVSVCLLKIGG